MKNISRRVFIKGMAVAAVATAASTVLTGCKLPAGVTEGETETVVTPANTYTYTNKTKSLTIKAPSCVTSTVGANAKTVNIAIPVDVTNNMGNTVTFTQSIKGVSSLTSKGTYVEVTVKGLTEDGLTLSPLALSTTAVSGSTLANIFDGSATSNASFGTNASASRMLSLNNVAEDWGKITVTLKVYEVVENNGIYGIDTDLENGKVEFTYSK